MTDMQTRAATRAAKDREQLTKWREAHQGIDIPENALLTAGPWPSLQLSEFIVWLDTKADVEENPEFKIVAKILRGLQREIRWTYDGWAKALQDGDPNKLLQTIFNDAKAPTKGDQEGGFAFVRKFIKDFAAAHGYVVDEAQQAPALDIFDELGIKFDVGGNGMSGGSVPTPLPPAPPERPSETPEAISPVDPVEFVKAAGVDQNANDIASVDELTGAGGGPGGSQ